jgi:hypothetical protein
MPHLITIIKYASVIVKYILVCVYTAVDCFGFRGFVGFPFRTHLPLKSITSWVRHRKRRCSWKFQGKGVHRLLLEL